MNDQPAPVAVQQTTVIQVGSQKNVVGAVLLGLFFGPLGMLYATVSGALIMFVINIFVAVVTLGIGLFFTLPICAIWAGFAADSHNKRLGVTGHQAALVGQASPVGWHPDPAGSGRLRYYDGTRWTDHYADHEEPQPTPVPSQQPQAPLLERSVELEPAEEEAATEVAEAEDADSEAPTRVAASESGSVFCGSCGAGVSPSARFCSGCGESQAVA